MSLESSEDTPEGRGAPPVLAASLFCENCESITVHRILRIDRSGKGPVRRIRGVARCRVCRLTHPFDSVPETTREVALIVSSGPTSERSVVSLPSHERLQVGNPVPQADPPLTIRRIEDRAGHTRPFAVASDVRTVWAARDEGAVVAVSLVEGGHTRSERVALPHGTRLVVGDPLHLEKESVEIVGLRARGRTWRRIGDEFSADEVARVYARLSSIPPAGKRPWSRVRDRPRSWASETSRASRPRSGPGTRTARTAPRARRAEGGAAVHSWSPE
jgi:uncharacterized Zn finger protein